MRLSSSDGGALTYFWARPYGMRILVLQLVASDDDRDASIKIGSSPSRK
jgi:hypothetical protein